jgi:hypothetical protein
MPREIYLPQKSSDEIEWIQEDLNLVIYGQEFFIDTIIGKIKNTVNLYFIGNSPNHVFLNEMGEVYEQGLLDKIFVNISFKDKELGADLSILNTSEDDLFPISFQSFNQSYYVDEYIQINLTLPLKNKESFINSFRSNKLSMKLEIILNQQKHLKKDDLFYCLLNECGPTSEINIKLTERFS